MSILVHAPQRIQEMLVKARRSPDGHMRVHHHAMPCITASTRTGIAMVVAVVNMTAMVATT
eukprot:10700240-Alexandrium_andersonii.AAC.1